MFPNIETLQAMCVASMDAATIVVLRPDQAKSLFHDIERMKTYILRLNELIKDLSESKK